MLFRMFINQSAVFTGFMIVLLSGLLAAGCSQSDDPSNTGSSSEKLSESSLPSELLVSSADSLLFSAAANSASQSLPSAIGDIPVIEFAYVTPEISSAQLADSDKGKQLYVSLGESLTVSIRINRNQAVGDQIRSLSGSLLAPHNGIATFSVNRDENTMTGMIDMLDLNRLFYLRYDRNSDQHYIMEIDRSKLDTLPGSEPLDMNN